MFKSSGGSGGVGRYSGGHLLGSHCSQVYRFHDPSTSEVLLEISAEIGVEAQYLRTTLASWALKSRSAACIPHSDDQKRGPCFDFHISL